MTLGRYKGQEISECKWKRRKQKNEKVLAVIHTKKNLKTYYNPWTSL